MIRLEKVNKCFGDLHVLKDVSLEVKEGEKLVIIGPSGSGKSTTVRCMNFLEEPTSGHVYINGTELTHKNKRQIIRDNMSMVFQQFNLYPHMTVLKNLTLAPIKLHHKSQKEAEELAYDALSFSALYNEKVEKAPQNEKSIPLLMRCRKILKNIRNRYSCFMIRLNCVMNYSTVFNVLGNKW